jgi:rRNA maturation endonuclease Nob1
MQVRVNWKKAKAWVRVRKECKAFKEALLQCCPCCGHEDVERALQRLWEARQDARNTR